MKPLNQECLGCCLFGFILSLGCSMKIEPNEILISKMTIIIFVGLYEEYLRSLLSTYAFTHLGLGVFYCMVLGISSEDLQVNSSACLDSWEDLEPLAAPHFFRKKRCDMFITTRRCCRAPDYVDVSTVCACTWLPTNPQFILQQHGVMEVYDGGWNHVTAHVPWFVL